MTQLNNAEPISITVKDGFNFWLNIDTTSYGNYLREGIVENVKVPKKVEFHTLE